MSTFQYAKSADPDVIATIERNARLHNEWAVKARKWAAERGSEICYQSTFAGRYAVTGLPTIPEGRGAWTGTEPHRPHKRNAEELAAMAALRYVRDEIPGMPALVHGKSSRNGVPLMTPRPFIRDGVAWVGLSSAPDQREPETYGPQWVEVKASEFYAAHEAATEETR